MGYGQWGHESDTAEWVHTCAHIHRRARKAFRIVTLTEGTTDGTVCYNHIITIFISIY